MGAIADPIVDIMYRQLPRVTRAALEEVFDHWHRAMAPEHFRRGAFGQYPSEYSASAKRDAEEWRRRHARDIKRGFKKREANPLRESGRLERAFLGGTVLFSGSNTRLRARWPNLPAYATRRNQYSDFQATTALVTVSDDERRRLSRVYGDWIAWNLRNISLMRPRTRGRIVIQL